MTRWREDEILRLRERLKQELDTAISQSQWQRLGTLSEALKLVDQRSADTGLDALTKQVEGLVGTELVSGVLEIAPTAQTAGIAAQGEKEQILLGTKTAIPPSEVGVETPATQSLPREASIESPVVQPLPEPSASTEALAVLPSSEPAPAEGGTAALFPIDPTLQARLPSLLQELRTWRDQEPQDVIGLPTYLGRLRRLAEEIMSLAPRSAEAVRATGDVALLQEMQTLFSEMQSTHRTMQAAKERLDLGKAKEAKWQADDLLKRAQDERYHQAFPSLAYGIQQAAEGLESEAETARQNVAAETRVYLTRQQKDERERLVSQLDDLDALIRKGVPLVPIDPTNPEIAKETTQVYADFRARLLALCVAEAERLWGEAQECLEDDLDHARERCQTGLEFVQTKHIKDDTGTKGIADKIQSLSRDIGKREERREAARVWFKQVADAKDPLEAFNALDQVESLYSKLPGLEEQRKRWLATLRTRLQQAVRSAKLKAETLARERKYLEALEAINEARRELAQCPPGVELDLTQFAKELDGKEQGILDEHSAWLAFQPRLDRLHTTSPVVADGRLDQAWIQQLEQQFDPQDLARFAREWQELKGDLARQAGDQASYDEALARFNQDPLAGSIAALLSGIPAGSSLHNQAQRLLRRHLGRVALSQAHQLLADPRLLESPDDWLNAITNQTRSVMANATEPEDAPVGQEAQALLSAAHRLHAVQEGIAGLLRTDQYAQAWEELKKVDADAAQDMALADGLRFIRFHLRRRWREARIGFVTGQVLDEVGQEYRLKPDVGAEDLGQAAAYMDELEEKHALTEDGDGLRAAWLRRTWHESEVAHSLGCDLADASEATIAQLAERHQVDWEELLTHLEGLTRHTGGYGSSARRTAERLRLVALGYCALDQPRPAAIARLKLEREKTPRLGEDPVLCSILALRLLEDAQDRTQVRDLAAGLCARGRSAQQLAQAIQLLLDAHELHGQGDLELAIATLRDGVSSCKELALDFGPGLDRAVQDTTQRWQRALGDQLREETLAAMPNAKGLTVLELLGKLRQAEELIPGDTRIETTIRRLQSDVEESHRELQDAVAELLERPPDPLESAIQRGEKLKGFLDEILDKTGPQAVSLFPQLAQDHADLRAQLAEWREAQRAVDSTRRTVQNVLEGDWRWNSDPRQAPMRELKEIQAKLATAESVFGDRVPLVVRNLRQLARDLMQAVPDISGDFERFARRFEGDEYGSEADFDEARDLLRQLQQKIESWERKIKDEANAVGLNSDLARFFLVHDLYGRSRPQDGYWVPGQAEDLKSLADALGLLEERRHNWKQWQEWVEQSVELLGSLQDGVNNTWRHVRGGRLGQSIKLCEETIPDILKELEAHRRRVPEPPLCQLALVAARNIGDFQPDPAGEAELQRTWEQLRSAPRAQMPTLWQQCLRSETSRARQQLGPAPEGQKPPEGTLQGIQHRKQAQLQAKIAEMNQHVRVYHRPTTPSQSTYANLLSEADKIDREDPEVRRHHDRYKQREQQLQRR